jgi:hypothetical protein
MIETETVKPADLKAANVTKWVYKRTIDTQIFVTPRRVILNIPGLDVNIPEEERPKLEFCERPLRGDTARGPRIALVRSEMAPEGTTVEIDIMCMNKKLEPYVENWLTFGMLYGLGGWRNSGMGRFTWEKID